MCFVFNVEFMLSGFALICNGGLCLCNVCGITQVIVLNGA